MPGHLGAFLHWRLSQCRPVWQPFLVDKSPHLARIKELDELLVHGAGFLPGEVAVFVKDGGEGPLLELAEAADETAGAMLDTKRRKRKLR